MIECTTLHGEKKLVEADKLEMRTAAYGIVIHEEHILLVNTKSTGKLFFPGGAIEKGEKIEEALHREMQEETGIQVEIKELFKIHESFFYYDPWDRAFQNFSFMYLCTPKTIELSGSANEKRDEAENPRWAAVSELKTSEFQGFAGDVFEEFKRSH